MKKYKKTVSKQKIKDFGAVFFVLLFFPYFIGMIFHGISPQKEEKKVANDTQVIVVTDIGRENIPLEEYLVGALAASINSQYEAEALKAQSVLLRTAVLYERMKTDENEILQEKTKQSYWSISDMQEHFGADFETTYQALKNAVDATENIVLTYQGELAKAPFFAVSAGKSRSGEEAFGNKDYPYLQSVSCADDMLSEDYLHLSHFTQKEAGGQIIIEKTDSAGYALAVKVGDRHFTGEEFRKTLHLYSSSMTVREEKEEIVIQTKGLGHGIGMSQFTANKMAQDGSDFIEILSYFFTDTEIEKN